MVRQKQRSEDGHSVVIKTWTWSETALVLFKLKINIPYTIKPLLPALTIDTGRMDLCFQATFSSQGPVREGAQQSKRNNKQNPGRKTHKKGFQTKGEDGTIYTLYIQINAT